MFRSIAVLVRMAFLSEYIKHKTIRDLEPEEVKEYLFYLEYRCMYDPEFERQNSALIVGMYNKLSGTQQPPTGTEEK